MWNVERCQHARRFAPEALTQRRRRSSTVESSELNDRSFVRGSPPRVAPAVVGVLCPPPHPLLSVS